MTLTRRSPRFGELAADIEERLAQLGFTVDPADVDADIRSRVRAVAERFGVSDRTALGYMTDDVADDVARSIVVTARATHDAPESRPSGRHLRLVE